MLDDLDVALNERRRILAEYSRRTRETDPALYASWQPAEMFMLSGRKRTAVRLLREAHVFPGRGEPVLEVGCGELGWMADLISWGLSQVDIHGIDLDSLRVSRARETFPNADIRVGDAAELPWRDDSFRLVIASTVFSSILNSRVRRMVAEEITRVVMPGGAVLCYDFVYNNPGNPRVHRVPKSEIRALFPSFRITSASVTLAPPITRLIAPISWTLATVLEAIPVLRTHLVAVMLKPETETTLASARFL